LVFRGHSAEAVRWCDRNTTKIDLLLMPAKDNIRFHHLPWDFPKSSQLVFRFLKQFTDLTEIRRRAFLREKPEGLSLAGSQIAWRGRSSETLPDLKSSVSGDSSREGARNARGGGAL
jgi:hypothetical protein